MPNLCDDEEDILFDPKDRITAPPDFDAVLNPPPPPAPRLIQRRIPFSETLRRIGYSLHHWKFHRFLGVVGLAPAFYLFAIVCSQGSYIVNLSAVDENLAHAAPWLRQQNPGWTWQQAQWGVFTIVALTAIGFLTRLCPHPPTYQPPYNPPPPDVTHGDARMSTPTEALQGLYDNPTGKRPRFKD